MDARKSLRMLTLVAAAILLVSMGVSQPAMAGGKRRHQVTTSGTLAVSPSVVPLNSTTVTISGSGWAPGQALIINTSMFPQPWINADSNGAFSIQYSPSGGFWGAGSAAVQALNPSTLEVLATAYYTVQ